MTKTLTKAMVPARAEKMILDACCGSRMFWFDRENPNVLFADIRREEHTLCDGRALKVNPNIISDFRSMPFPDNHFKLVVFDPPHMKTLGANSWMAKKYGRLNKHSWQEDIKKGFDECMRVLCMHGTLIFKWSESEVKLSELLRVINTPPLFGHTTGRQSKTIWMCFMKLKP
jgi:hypothetical protein